MNSGVENGGIPAEVSTPSPREESRVSDTPLRSENEREATANEAEENKTVTISQKEYTRLLQLLKFTTADERNNKNTPNVPPLTFEHQGQDMQEKPAALGGEKPATCTELMELKATVTLLQEKLDQTTPNRSGQQETNTAHARRSPHGPRPRQRLHKILT